MTHHPTHGDPADLSTADAGAPGPGVRRVLLKLSGEVFGGGKIGIDPDVVNGIARQVAQAVREGAQVAIVIGMLGTVMNSLALQDFIEKQGIDTRVQSAITMGQVAEPYIPRRAMRHLEKGRVVIFGAGAGMPYFSTDTVAAQRALEIKADAVLMSKSGVDGVYSADPRTDASARRFDDLTFAEALRLGLKVVDAAAFALCMENDLPMIVFGMEGEGNIARVLQGERIGTLVHGDAGPHIGTTTGDAP